MKYLPLIALVALVFAGCDELPRPSKETAPQSPPSGAVVDKDNTGVNARDQNTSAKTPIDQNENQADIDITAKIRKQVVDTKLSVNAQNVKIITQDGRVTLRGPVKTAEEKKQIEEIAHAIAGAGKVDNQLEVEQNP